MEASVNFKFTPVLNQTNTAVTGLTETVSASPIAQLNEKDLGRILKVVPKRPSYFPAILVAFLSGSITDASVCVAGVRLIHKHEPVTSVYRPFIFLVPLIGTMSAKLAASAE